MNSGMTQRNMSKGCPEDSVPGPRFWKILDISLLNLNYIQNTKVIAYADDLMILVKGTSQVEDENYANTEAQKVANWARNNKMNFNDQKT